MQALVALLMLAAGAMPQPPRQALIGSWRGTSLCTNREAAPACADEQVIYDIAAAPGSADAVIVKADKIVNGQREPMGDITFHPDPATAQWISEIETPRVRAVWHLTIKDGALSGGLDLLPSGTAVRKIELRRMP